MRIVLGIESSCDETAVALVREDGHVLAQALASQLEEHRAYGGVVPEIAARAHLQQISALHARAMRESGVTLGEVDAIAATTGPGLIGGVIVGAMFAKALAAASDKPWLAINHLEGHALTVRLTHQAQFPYALLLISGGHCQILTVHGVGHYQVLGGTRDDALGEAFDKCAKMLGLPYPGGPALERAALSGNPTRFAFPRPMVGHEGYAMSFSGLKTAVRLAIAEAVAQNGALTEALVQDVAASFQAAVCDVLEERVGKALAHACALAPITALAVAGGVAANQAIHRRLQQVAAARALPLLVAPPALCTDNAVMIAWAGMERLKLGVRDGLDTQPRARWPLAELTLASAPDSQTGGKYPAPADC